MHDEGEDARLVDLRHAHTGDPHVQGQVAGLGSVGVSSHTGIIRRGGSRGIQRRAGDMIGAVPVEYDNPAGRLHHLLSQIKEAPQNQQLRVAWTFALGPDLSADPPTMLEAIAAAQRLPERARNALLAVPGEKHELHLRWWEPVRGAMSIAHQFETATSTFANQYNEAHLQSLETCADILERRSTGPRLDHAGLNEATALAGEVLDALRLDTDLDPDTREVLIRHAAALYLALQLADVTGAEGVRDAAAAALGSVLVVAREHPGDIRHPILTRFWKMAAGAAVLITLSDGPRQIEPIIEKLIELTQG